MTFTVSCPSCDTSFPVDPAKVPPEGVRAQCSNCPEIFDVDRPSEVTPEAPATESTAETLEVSDPLDAAIIDPPPVEEPVEEAESTAAAGAMGEATVEATGGESAYGDVSETEDFGAIDMAFEAPETA